MCVACHAWNFSSSSQTLRALERLPLFSWCDFACQALAAALVDDNQLLLGGRAGRTPPPGRGATAARRGVLTAGLSNPPLLSAAQLLHLKRFCSEEAWEWLASAFSYHNARRARHHTSWCSKCSPAGACEQARDARINLLTAAGQTASDATRLYLPYVGQTYERVAHRLIVDDDLVTTLVHNEWSVLKRKRPPPVDGRYGCWSSKRTFDVARRAVHRQLHALRGASRTTLSRCAYVVLAAVRAYRQSQGMTTLDYRLPRQLRSLQPTDVPLGRHVLLRYSAATNQFTPHYQPPRCSGRGGFLVPGRT
jgi:hypothetical protein